jgi:hydrogenase-4 component F
LLIWIAGRIAKRGKATIYILHIVASIFTSIIGLAAVSHVINGETFMAFDKTLLFDPISGVFVTVISVAGLLVNLYSVKYIDWELKEKVIEIQDAVNFFALSQLFVFTMLLSVTANNIVIMWAAVEATTLSSLFLVSLYKNKRATEGGWKYIVICSIGLAFALYGTILTYSSAYDFIKNAHEAMLWTSLIEHAQELNPDILRIIFVFVLIGYGTKAGLAPTHTWLPDAHAEAPSPSSAMLSAVLLKCAMAAIIRYYALVGQSPLGFGYPKMMFLFVGLLSIIIASFFILRQSDVKRMLAYSSSENLGIIAVGLGFGGPLGLFASLFHVMNHSLTKALAFCTSGNLMEIYGTRDMRKMGGLVHIAPLSAFFFGVAIMSLAGTPPLAIFTSEFYTILSGLKTHDYFAVAIFLAGLAIVFTGLITHLNKVLFGKPRGEIKHNGEVDMSANIPLFILAVLVCTFGILAPTWWTKLLQSATRTILGS